MTGAVGSVVAAVAVSGTVIVGGFSGALCDGNGFLKVDVEAVLGNTGDASNLLYLDFPVSNVYQPRDVDSQRCQRHHDQHRTGQTRAAVPGLCGRRRVRSLTKSTSTSTASKGNSKPRTPRTTIHARNSSGTSLDAGLGSTTMTLVSTGKYKVTYTVASTDTAQEVLFDAAWAVGAAAFAISDATEVQDAEQTATLTAIKGQTDKIATNAADSPNTITMQGRVDATVSSRLATSGYTAPDNADVAAVKAVTDKINTGLVQVGSTRRYQETTEFLATAPAGGGSGGFSGPSSVAPTFVDSHNAAVPNVVFSVVGVGATSTDASGIKTVNLSNGSTPCSRGTAERSVVRRYGADGQRHDRANDHRLGRLIPCASGSRADHCRIKVIAPNGGPGVGLVVEFETVAGPGTAGYAFSRYSVLGTAGGDGMAYAFLPKSCTARARLENGDWTRPS